MTTTSPVKILTLVLAAALFGAACQKPATTNSQPLNAVSTTNTAAPTNTTTETEATIELANLGGAVFATAAPGSSLAGSFKMLKSYLDAGAGRTVPVYMFGQALPGRAMTQLNPNLEFGGLPTALEVVAAIDGVVGFVRPQSESNDFEVFLQPQENSTWTIGYDHLTDVTVKQGDRVTVGQVLGKAARENNDMYRYELQINRDLAGETTFHCPTALLKADVKATTEASIARFIQDWNSLYGSKAYGSITSGCTKPTLTLSETGG